jgi:bifunctional enzyme CysN/CysC
MLGRPITSAPSIEHMNIVIVGHVDHGKSTLLGRLFADTGSLPEGKLDKVREICRRQGKEFEYAFLFDAFLEEQEQGITIDSARTFFKWKDREYIIIDAPGHKEFLKNMISGAARAEAALLLIDAQEGVKEQSKRHGHLLSLLGVRQVAVVVNKMDLVGFRQDVFDAIEKEYRDFLTQIRVAPERFIPASAKLGDNIAEAGAHMPWYRGPTVLDALGLFRKELDRERQPLRFPVQDVYKFDARRIIAGRIASGKIRVGDRLIFSPSNKSALVKSIEAFNVEPVPAEAKAGESTGITLDEQIFIERGEIGSHPESVPLESTAFRCNLFWLGRRPLEIGKKYLLRLATREVECEVSAIHRIIDATALEARVKQHNVGRNEVAEVTIRTKSPIAFDRYTDFEVSGRFVLVDQYDLSGGGIIMEVVRDEQTVLREEARQRDISWSKGDVALDERAAQYGHRAALVLITGDAQSGTFLARRLEVRLVADSRHAYLLAAENLRRGLDSDIGEEDAEDAREMVRRFGEVARLLIDTGLIVVSTNTFGRNAVETIRTLVHPAPVIVVQMSNTGADPLPNADLAFAGPKDFDAIAERIVGELKHRGVLAQAIGAKQQFHYSI